VPGGEQNAGERKGQGEHRVAETDERCVRENAIEH
jgi:hypothetical protein